MKLRIHVRQSEQGGYVASCPTLPGCITRGQTTQEACDQMDEAIRGYLASVGDFVPEKIADEVVLEVG